MLNKPVDLPAHGTADQALTRYCKPHGCDVALRGPKVRDRAAGSPRKAGVNNTATLAGELVDTQIDGLIDGHVKGATQGWQRAAGNGLRPS
ncbi:hypothetical protein [Corynebacterium cystitidis]|uniref:hypothetical protein n=1 Tax=Corynebacterium cystitidis TaxID=35757 RepID=UPI000B87B375|nr:hypothetical protein [Corynebacterium cystitidis]